MIYIVVGSHNITLLDGNKKLPTEIIKKMQKSLYMNRWSKNIRHYNVFDKKKYLDV